MVSRLFATIIVLAATPVLAGPRSVDLPIRGGVLPAEQRVIRVQQGDEVTLRWTSDRALTVHLHGYDIEQELKPGTVTQMTFTAHATGRFTIEPHIGKTPSGGHTHGDVLVTIEVYP